MAGDDQPLRPLSGASLGLSDAPPQLAGAAPSPFDQPEPGRYIVGGLLGRGGMGEVYQATDLRLGREVALKIPRLLDPVNQGRLETEAILTSRLDHPAIVPILDAGRDRQGRPFYTMPIVRGRSLDLALKGADLPTRLGYVRHLLDACQAVAYAHAQGLVHRDLKPSNIMVGAFGETLVMDWGLAAPAGLSPSPRGGDVGTPGYMPPEQRRGQSLHPTADVYALGASLYELLTGGAPGPGPHPVRESAPEAPADLAAIAHRALMPSPADRYPDAGVMAADLAAWFEGRRVSVHTYTLGELLRRAWAAQRAPITVGLVALLVVGLSVLIGYRRTAVESARAREAEQQANLRREEAEANLALAQIAQALEAKARGEQAEAEILASSALLRGESPEARGVLARFDPRSRPRLIDSQPAPPCSRLTLPREGDLYVCATDSWIRIYREGDPAHPVLEVPTKVHAMRLTARARHLVILDTAWELRAWEVGSGRPPIDLGRAVEGSLEYTDSDRWIAAIHGGVEHIFDLTDGSWRSSSVCHATSQKTAGALAIGKGGAVVAACLDGSLYLTHAGHALEWRRLGRLSQELGTPLYAFFSGDERQIAFTTTTARLVVMDAATGEVLRSIEAPTQAVRTLALDEGVLAAIGSTADVTLWDVASGEEIARIPSDSGSVQLIRGATALRVASSRLETWALPTRRPLPHLRSSPSGVSVVALSPDGEWLASGHGDGAVRLWRIGASTPTVVIPLHTSVVKDLEFSPDGRQIAAVCAQGHAVHFIDTAPPFSTRQIPTTSSRRVAWLKGDVVVLGTYAAELLVLTDLTGAAPPYRLGLRARLWEMDSLPDRSAVVVRENQGQFWTLSADAPTRLVVGPWRGDHGIPVAAGDHMVAYLLHRMELFVKGRSVRTVPWSAGYVSAMAMSPDTRHVAVGRIDGPLHVLDGQTMETLALLRGHTQRVTSVAVDATSSLVVSGGWDGDIRLWSLDSLRAPAEKLHAELATTWGRDVQDALRRSISTPR